MADNEIPLDRQDPAEPVKKAEKPKKETERMRLPLLIEFTVMVCAIFLVLVFFTIVGISVLTGANLLDFVTRTSISIAVIGSLLVIIARQISTGMFSEDVAVKEEKVNISDELEMPSPPEVK